MAEINPPNFLDIDEAYGADEFGRPFRDIFGEGVVGETDLAVSEKAGGATMSVDVAAGSCYVQGGTASTQPTYRCYSDGVKNLAISGSDPTDDRWDLIVAEVRDETYAGAFSDWRLNVVQGTADPSPADPTVPDTAIVLARVVVQAAATSIVDGDIEDLRPFAVIGRGDAIVGPNVGTYAARPTAGMAGRQYIESLTGTVWFDTGSEWIALGNAPGTIVAFGGSAPTGYLLCDGSAVSRTTYAALFAAIGTSYGVGDGSTTFNLPDFVGRTILGEDSGTYDLGDEGGAATVTLTTSQMPSHSHGGATASGGVDHTHAYSQSNELNVNTNGGTSIPANASQFVTSTGGASAYLHTHGISAEGGGAAHENLPPYGVAAFLVKA